MAIREFTYRYESAWSGADELLLHLDTGNWRTVRPVVDAEKCTYCGLCALYCPQCMLSRGDCFEPNLEYFKGCGICAAECKCDKESPVERGRGRPEFQASRWPPGR